LDAKEAERIGLVSMCVPPDQLMPKAMEVARKLSNGSQSAIRWTKQSLNQWLRAAAHTSFDYSLALEMLGFFGADVKEGLASIQEKRAAKFPSAQGKK
jgi:enoyl-CoA hydratase